MRQNGARHPLARQRLLFYFIIIIIFIYISIHRLFILICRLPRRRRRRRRRWTGRSPGRYTLYSGITLASESHHGPRIILQRLACHNHDPARNNLFCHPCHYEFAPSCVFSCRLRPDGHCRCPRNQPSWLVDDGHRHGLTRWCSTARAYSQAMQSYLCPKSRYATCVWVLGPKDFFGFLGPFAFDKCRPMRVATVLYSPLPPLVYECVQHGTAHGPPSRIICNRRVLFCAVTLYVGRVFCVLFLLSQLMLWLSVCPVPARYLEQIYNANGLSKGCAYALSVAVWLCKRVVLFLLWLSERACLLVFFFFLSLTTTLQIGGIRVGRERTPGAGHVASDWNQWPPYSHSWGTFARFSSPSSVPLPIPALTQHLNTSSFSTGSRTRKLLPRSSTNSCEARSGPVPSRARVHIAHFCVQCT